MLTVTGLGTGLGAAGVLGLPTLIAWQGDRLLADAGMPDSRVEVTRLGWSNAAIDVWQGAGTDRRIGRIDLDYGFTTGISGRVDMDLPLAGLAGDGIAMPGAALRTAGAVRSVDGRWIYDPEGCVTIAANGVEVGDVVVNEPRSVCLEASPGEHFLTYDLADGLTLAFGIKPAALKLAVAGTPVAGRSPAISVIAALAATGAPLKVAVNWRQGSLTLPRQSLTGDGFKGELFFDPDREQPLSTNYAFETIHHDQRVPAFAPVGLKGQAEGDPAGVTRFKARIADPTNAVAVDVTGQHDGQVGAGWLEAKAARIAFPPGEPSFTTLFPIVGGWAKSITGTFGLDGRYEWGEGAGPGRASVMAEDAAVDTGGFTARGINAVVAADRLSPLRLPPGQIVSIGLMDVGLPLTDAVIDFGVVGDKLSIARAEWRWAGGLVRTHPFETRLTDQARTIELEAEGVDLRQLLSVAGVDGLEATGSLRGRLPVHLGSGGAVTIDGGKLETTGPGTLRYNPDEPPSFLSGDPGSGTDMLLKALTDFHYEALDLTVNGTAGGEMAISFAIRGSNPGFYDGYPVALNLNVGGALDTILRRGISTYNIPDAVRDRIMDFQAQRK
ncbi:intermembrane phospholipid transport protein YdbH family protein [Skermanella stibiiresistens]|uniref:intermembrane phospholipid transport protein YdbH family protein n=1 Tax=Skermanella stibiiresistens TaxID=913326 RepID=UPI0004AC5DAD|nr:YdbH domain-containing protein [Skermanella stibiiresistens]